MWGLGVDTDVVQNLQDIGAVGDKRDQAHLPTALRAQEREHFVDARYQHRPQVVPGNVWVSQARAWVGSHGPAVSPQARPRQWWLARFASWGLGHGHHRRPEWRVRGQHSEVAVPVGAWRWHQRCNADVGLGGVVVALAVKLACAGQLKPGLEVFGYGLVEQRAFGVARVVELGLCTRWTARMRMRVRWACSGGQGGSASVGWVPDDTVVISSLSTCRANHWVRHELLN